MKAYDFDEQMASGNAAEDYLDSLFCTEFAIQPANRQQQRQGIDRIFTHRTDSKKYKIEYKADSTAARTGNAFVETVSVDTINKPGWAYTCQADFILYYIVGLGPIYVLRPSAIRNRLARWIEDYPQKPIPNGSYRTIGILVPLDEFEKAAVKVINT